MTARVYRSTDRGAPRIAGTTGDLTSWLDAILLNGYGSQTVTLTRSGSTVTVTDTGHGLGKCARRLISGADQAEYNGEFEVTVTGANTYTYQITGTPATPATGTITAITPASGWTIPYTATNVRVCRPPAGNRFYVRVADTGTGSAAYARVRGFVNMVDAVEANGTEPFPTDVQFSGGLYIHKSNAVSTTARAWMAVVTDKTITLHVAHSGTAQYATYFFGDITTYHAGYSYNTLLIATPSSSNTITLNDYEVVNTGAATAIPGHYLARNYTNSGTSSAPTKVGGHAISSSGIVGNFGYSYPSVPDANLLVYNLELATVSSTAMVLIGSIPGVIAPHHNSPLTVGDTFEGVGEFAGKTYEVRDLATSGSQAFFEISDTF